ncbi:MAG: ATP-binding protein [Candidatus Aminicenantaceae bacterium]
MEEISLHILDIAQNSIKAEAGELKIIIDEKPSRDTVVLEIIDNGKGMDPQTLRRAGDPFFTTKRRKRYGLGIPLLAQAAETAGGRFSIDSKPGNGTHLKAVLQASHIDRQPLGDMSATITTLLASHPEIDLTYTHQYENDRFVFRTDDIKSRIGKTPIDSTEVLKFIQSYIQQGLDGIRRKK